MSQLGGGRAIAYQRCPPCAEAGSAGVVSVACEVQPFEARVEGKCQREAVHVERNISRGDSDAVLPSHTRHVPSEVIRTGLGNDEQVRGIARSVGGVDDRARFDLVERFHRRRRRAGWREGALGEDE